MADSTKLQPGTVFARDFKIVKSLKDGGMGSVYIAEQMSTGRQRALKLLIPELVHNPDIRERFIREARVSANIESDHVVETVTAGVDEDTGAPYIVMELLRGEELGDAARRIGPLTVGDVREVYSQIGHALEQAHAQGLVHRDLKPENVFLAASKRREVPFTAKILDFGIAKLVADGMQKTQTAALGSPLYMSPEQTDRKGKISPATDVWALGLIAFYLLTGQSFWEAAKEESLPQLLREICVDEIPRASERAKVLGVDGMLPPGFDAWFARCVDRDIDKRFPEAGECVRAFVELVADRPSERKLSLVATSSMMTGSVGSREIDAHAHTTLEPSRAAIDSADSRPAKSVTSMKGTTGGAAISVQDTPPAPPQKSKAPLFMGAALAAGLLGGGVWFVATSPGKTTSTATAGTGTASNAASDSTASATAAISVGSAAPTSSALAPADARCPAGMIHHPAGKTFMGSRTLPDAAGAKVDGRKVQLSSFCLDVTEVTVSAYQACVSEGACEKATEDVNYAGVTPESKKLFSPLCNGMKKDRLEHPINCVSFRMAEAYCQWKKARLPTEAEWEYAARGKGQADYPWGNEAPDATRLNAAGAEFKKWSNDNGRDDPTMFAGDDHWVGTAPVASFPAGKSGYGVHDLAGNVWEWVQDWYAEYQGGDFTDPKGPDKGTERVIRGGAFNGANPEWANPAWRYRAGPDQYSHAIGFRCAADAIGEPRAAAK